jgi:hypothetical protein
MDNITESQHAFGRFILDKVQKYGWEIKDEPGQYRLVAKHVLKINHNYQRETSNMRVAEIRAKWSWVSCGALIVAERDGELWVLDGQHRLEAAKARSDIQKMPCLIFQTSGVQEEAEGFIDTNVNRKPVATFDKWKALIVSGDPLAQRIEALFIKLEIRTRRAGNTRQARTLAFLGSAYREAQRDFDSFETVMILLADLCEETNLRETLFLGFLYLAQRGLDLNDPKLRRRIIAIGPDRLDNGITKARAFYSRGGTKIYGAGLLEEINRNLTNKFRLPE